MPNILDIIIPIYNTPEEYLVACLSSINRQRFIDYKTLGVIVVDNASKEIKYKKSWFKQRFPKLQITFIVNEKNLGPGLSRQVGLDHSEAKYVTFLDSDDEIYGNDSLSKVQIILRDLNVSRFHTAYFEQVKVNNKIEIVRHNNTSLKCLHAHYFNREFLVNNNIRFPKDFLRHEDVYFLSLAIALSTNSNAYLDDETYLWKWYDNSIVRSIKEPIYALEDFFKAEIESLRFLDNINYVNTEKTLSNLFSLYVMLDSNVFDYEIYNDIKEPLEKYFYDYFITKRELFDALNADEIAQYTKVLLDSHSRSYPWIVLKTNFHDYISKLDKKYKTECGG